MSENENWIDSFRTQSRENVYVLKVSIIEENKEVKNIREVVDGPEGEVGVWYANNLLCRLANEALKGMEYDKISWSECPDMVYWNSDKEYRYLKPKYRPDSDKNYAYMKSKDRQNYVVAEMKWYQQLPEESENPPQAAT